MKRIVKIVIAGPFSAGKTEFIKSVSEIPVVATERKLSHKSKTDKEETTVAMDYGRTTLKDMTIQLFGTPGQPRFDFMWDILAKEMNGFVIIVDSADPSTFAHAKKMIALFCGFDNVPYIVAANKQDLAGAISPQKLRTTLALDPTVKVAQCIATDKMVIRQVLLELIKDL